MLVGIKTNDQYRTKNFFCYSFPKKRSLKKVDFDDERNMIGQIKNQDFEKKNTICNATFGGEKIG